MGPVAFAAGLAVVRVEIFQVAVPRLQVVQQVVHLAVSLPQRGPARAGAASRISTWCRMPMPVPSKRRMLFPPVPPKTLPEPLKLFW